MAAASGQPQDISTEKKQVTPEQRKLFIGLGVMGALALVVGAMYLPRLLSGGSSSAGVAPVASNSLSASSPGGAAALSGGAGQVSPGIGTGTSGRLGSAPGTAMVGTATSGISQPLARSRRDPFEQPYFFPTPVPAPRPTLAPPPIPTPLPPIPVPSPSDMDLAPLALPGINGSAALQRPLILPPVTIGRLDQSTRRPAEAFPPTRTLGAAGGAGVPSPSYDKRLSGVVIADGVRAILEIQGPSGPISRVVQPGDEVEGITILNIQRFNDGTRTVTRMLIRENGEERTVDLRAGAPRDTGGSGSFESGSSGSSGASRGFRGSGSSRGPGAG